MLCFMRVARSTDGVSAGVGDLMGDKEEYRRNAADCLHWARTACEPEIQAMFLNMAHAWARLAEQAERNSKGYIAPQSDPHAPVRSDKFEPE